MNRVTTTMVERALGLNANHLQVMVSRGDYTPPRVNGKPAWDRPSVEAVARDLEQRRVIPGGWGVVVDDMFEGAGTATAMETAEEPTLAERAIAAWSARHGVTPAMAEIDLARAAIIRAIRHFLSRRHAIGLRETDVVGLMTVPIGLAQLRDSTLTRNGRVPVLSVSAPRLVATADFDVFLRERSPMVNPHVRIDLRTFVDEVIAEALGNGENAGAL